MSTETPSPWALERAGGIATNVCDCIGAGGLCGTHRRIADALDAARAEGRRDAFSHAADVAMFRAHDTINMGAYDEDHDWEAQALRTSAAGAYRDIESRLRALAGDPPKEP